MILIMWISKAGKIIGYPWGRVLDEDTVGASGWLVMFVRFTWVLDTQVYSVCEKIM